MIPGVISDLASLFCHLLYRIRIICDTRPNQEESRCCPVVLQAF